MNTILTLGRNIYLPILPIIQWGIYFVLNAIFLVFIPTILRILFKFSWKDNFFSFSLFGKLGCAVFNIKVKLDNPNNINLKQQYIMASNHRSWFDQIAIMGAIPQNTHFLAKADYFKVPLFKFCLKAYQVIPVHRKMLKPETQKDVDSYIANGDSFCYFVEGTRGSGRKLLKFRKGAFLQAAKTNKPILPIYLLGTEECLSKKNSLLSVKGGKVKIVIDEPLYFSEENLEEQISVFENNYTHRYNKLYDDFQITLAINNNKLIHKSFKEYSV